jgi:hypothetical protein
MNQPRLTKNHVKSHLQKYREALKKGKIRPDSTTSFNANSPFVMDPYDEGSDVENDAPAPKKKSRKLKAEDEVMNSPDSTNDITRTMRHHTHNIQQVQNQQAGDNEDGEVNDVFLSILRVAAQSDRKVLLELVETMKQMTKPEHCNVMLRGFNMGVVVGVRFANLISEHSPSPPTTNSSPDSSDPSPPNANSSPDSGDSPNSFMNQYTDSARESKMSSSLLY